MWTEKAGQQICAKHRWRKVKYTFARIGTLWQQYGETSELLLCSLPMAMLMLKQALSPGRPQGRQKMSPFLNPTLPTTPTWGGGWGGWFNGSAPCLLPCGSSFCEAVEIPLLVALPVSHDQCRHCFQGNSETTGAAKNHEAHQFSAGCSVCLVCRQICETEGTCPVCVYEGCHSIRPRFTCCLQVSWQCQNKKRRTPKGYAIQSNYGCLLCCVHLGKAPCFAQFHLQLAQQHWRYTCVNCTGVNCS